MIYISIILLFVIPYIYGLSLTQLLRVDKSLAYPLGISFTVIFANILIIVLNFDLVFSRLLLFGCCFLVSIFTLKYNNNIKFEWSLAVIILCLIFIMLPVYIGGEQFYSFRGNWWDHFNYMSGVLALKYEKINYIRNSILNNSLVGDYAQRSLSSRPSASIIASLFYFNKNISLFSYLYLGSLLLMNIPIILKISNNITHSKINSAAITLSLIIGYWGQLYIDIAVWSHILSIPIMFGIFYTLFNINNYSNWVSFLSLFIMVTSFIIVYPEGALYVLAVLGTTIFFTNRTKVIHILGISICSLLAIMLIDYSGTFATFISQFFKIIPEGGNFLSKTGLLYFGQPYTGFDFTSTYYGKLSEFKNIVMDTGFYPIIKLLLTENPENILLLLNVIPVTLSLYYPIFLLTSYNVLIGTSVSALIIILLLMHISTLINCRSDTKKFLYTLVSLSFISLLILFLFGKYWEATKAVSYIIPVIVIIYFSMIANIIEIKAKKLRFILFSLFLLSNLSFGFARIYHSFEDSGIGHQSPFPSVIRKEHKLYYRYFTPNNLETCDLVYVYENNVNRRHYLLNIGSANKPAIIIDDLSYYLKNREHKDCLLQFSDLDGNKIFEPVIK
jgi:hypothetical protein